MCSTSLLVCRIPKTQLELLSQKLEVRDMSGNEKNNYVARARICEASDRFEDMAKFMKSAAECGAEFSEEEINLFSYAYKSIIKGKRNQFRTVSTACNELSPGDRKKQFAEEFKGKIGEEIRDVSNEIIDLLERYLLPKSRNAETKVCCLMMKADYTRYLAEISDDDQRLEYGHNALKVYQEAFELAKTRLTPTTPLRLNLALNYSVLHYDILNSSARACFIAKQAFDDAVLELETLNEDAFKRATLVMKLLTDNLSLWETGIQELQQDALDDDNEDV